MRALLVKVSSLGDLTHALPAITDAKQALPDITFDWVVDEAFKQVPMLHPAVDRVIPTAHRRWKKKLFKSLPEILSTLKKIRTLNYDKVIDGQTSFKAAIITSLTRGYKCGPGWYSSREKGVQFAYNECFTVDKEQHAIDRLRQLFAFSLGYPLPETKPDYGIDLSRLVKPNLDLPKEYLVFILNGSWESKTYPISYAFELVNIVKDVPIYLSWGNEKEYQRSKRIAQCRPHVHILPKLSVLELMSILKEARGVLSVDTGPAHLTAMLGTAQVTLYGSTDPFLIGTVGENQHHYMAPYTCLKCYKTKCPLADADQISPVCFSHLTPIRVAQAIERELGVTIAY